MSGQLALSIVGAGVGAVFGQPAAGWAIGSAVGGALFAPRGQDQRQPLLEDLAVESGSYGTPIPKIFGQMRVRGILVWQSERRPTRHKEDVGGKGGGGGSITTYTYSMDIMVMLCEAPITAVRKIYLNGKLYYDSSIGVDAETLLSTDAPWDDLRIHMGGASQLPDPTYEAAIGEGLVPAYRDVVTVMLENMQLEDFGNNPPNITAEVVTGPLSYKGPPIGPTTILPGRPIYEQDGIIDYVANLASFYSSSSGVIGTRERYSPAGELLESTVIPYTYINVPADPNWLFNQIHFVGTVRGLQGWWVVTVREENASAGLVRYLQAWVGPSGISSPNLLNLDGSLLITGNHVSTDTYGCATQYYNGAVYTLRGSSWWISARVGVTIKKYDAPDETPSIHNVAEFHGGVIPPIGGFSDLHVTGDGVFIITSQGGSPSTTFGIIQLDHDLNFINSWINDPATTMNFGVVELAVQFPLAIRTSQTVANYFVYQLNDDAGGSPYSPGTLTILETGTIGQNTSNSRQKLIVGDDVGVLGRGYEIITFGLNSTDELTLANVETQLCVEAGLAVDDIDVSELETDIVIGYARTNPASVADMNRPLQPAYQFDVISSDWQLKFPKRARPTIALTVPYTELSAHLWGQETPEPLSLTRTPDRELLRRVHVDYLSEARDYQTNSQYAGREAIDAKDEETLQLAMLLEDDQARQIAEIYLADNWASRDNYPLTLGMKYLALDPTDVIAVETPSAAHLMRITNIDLALPGLMTIQARSIRAPALIDEAETEGDDYVYEEDFDDAQIDEPYTSTAPGAEAPVEQESTLPVGPTDLLLLDLPIQRDADDNAGLYWASRGYTSGWSGAVVFRSADGTAYTEVDSVFRGATMGYATTTLASGSLTVIDQASSVNVRVSGEIISITEAQFLNRENLGLLGAHGRWEVFAFRDKVLEADGTYTLSYLLRGLRGTDHNIGNHTASDRFVLLTGPGVDRFLTSVDDDAVLRYYKGVSIGKSLSSADAQTLISNTESLRPLSPVHVRGKRVSGGDLTITWVRRTRIAQTWGVANLAPVGEASQSYSIDILNGAGTVVLRTLTSSSESVAYTAAQQTTDFGSAQASINVRVFQVSQTVGRGTGRAATI